MDLSEKEVSIGLSPKGGGEMMSPYSISDEELDRLDDMVANDDDLFKELTILRGGCSCHIWAPCGACSNPLTVWEAIGLGIYEDPTPPQGEGAGS